MCTGFFVPSTTVSPRLSGENEPIDQSSENNDAPLALLHPLDQSSYTSSKSVNTIQPPPLLRNPLPEMAANNHPHTAEDEMEAWLDYSIEEFYSEHLHPNSTTTVSQPPVTAKSLPEKCSTPPRLPVKAISLQEHRVTLPQLPTRGSKIPRSAGNALSGHLEMRRSEITVVGSNDTPVISGTAVIKVAPIVADTTIPVIRGVGEDLAVGESSPQEGLMHMSSPMTTSATNSANAGTTGTTSGDASVRRNKRKIRDSDEKTTSASEPENKTKTTLMLYCI